MSDRQPVLRPQRAPLFSARPFAYQDQVLTIDGLRMNTLAAEFGTPLYVYSAANIRHRLSLFTDSFAATSHTVCYAVKANSSLAILQMLGRLGTGFDIVSGGELERVKRAYEPALCRVVFSGVGKQVWEIDAALQARILLFNVESADELELLAARAKILGVQARFALRVNPDVFAETHPYISTGLRDHKFGVDIGRARDLYRLAARHQSLCAAGVSVHIGSQIQAVEPFAQALSRVSSLVGELRADGQTITHIDVGGGLGIDYATPLLARNREDERRPAAKAKAVGSDRQRESQTQGPITADMPEDLFSPADHVEAYAQSLLPQLASLDCHLLLEPGRFLVAQAGGLLTRVIGVKENGVKRFVITDAAMNDLVRPALYQAHHEIVPVRLSGGTLLQTVDVVGPVCESGDFFAHDRELPELSAGDLAVLLDVGAYGMSQASNYNTRVRPAEILVDGGEAHLIRRRESFSDLLGPEALLP